MFKRVGSHVVQVHGYENTAEYRKEYGLTSRETRTEEYAESMKATVKEASIKACLEEGLGTRFTEGGGHADHLKDFWKNRKSKQELREPASRP